MHITGLGVVLLPLGAMLFFFTPRIVYYASIFFVPFTATSLLNTSSGVPLSPGIYFGGLFILHEITIVILKMRMVSLWRMDKTVSLWLAFLATAVLSVMFPYALGDGASFISIGDPDVRWLNYSISSIKGIFPVLFGITFLFFVIRRNLTEDSLKRTVQIYMMSGVFVCMWGYFEFACSHVLHIDYPDFIFNNSILETMRGHKQIINIAGNHLTRISSVLHEPSIFAKFLMTILPVFWIGAFIKKDFLINTEHWLARSINIVLLLFVIGVLLLSMSGSAYIGLVITPIVAGGLFLLAKRLGLRCLLLLKVVAILVPILGILLWMLPISETFFYIFILDKMDSGSAMMRVGSVQDAWLFFEHSPILGAGWAMVTSNDLVVWLLANVGVIGFLFFFLAIGAVIVHSFISIRWLRAMQKFRTKDLLGLVLALTASLLSLLMVSLITGIELYLEYFYLILALTISANMIAGKQMGYSRQLKSKEIIGVNKYE